MSSSSTTDFIVSSAVATRVLVEAEVANSKAHRAKMEAIEANARAREAESNWRNTDEGLRKRVEELAREKNREKAFGEKMMAKNDQLEAALAQQEALILEWMHSNEAFKRLARQYGKKIGVTDEQRQRDFDQNVLDIAEEDPKFADTKKTHGAKGRLGSQ